MGGKIRSVNPATEQVLKEYELMREDEVIRICKEVRKAFADWKSLDLKERTNHLLKIAKILRDRKMDLGKLITLEMGKPIKESVAEIEKCAWSCEVYAENAEKWLTEEVVEIGARRSFVTFEPLGVILSIMPWNFPFWQVFRFAIPALTVGNVSVLKHSNLVPQCALVIEGLFKEAGFPENVFRTILTDHQVVSDLILSDYVEGVSLTGSVETGTKIGELAGRGLKRVVLELGGSDPFIVLADADLDLTAENAVRARFMNTGQSCICAKRFIVVKEVSEEFTERFIEITEKLEVGDPLDPRTDVGPLASEQQLLKLQEQVEDAISKNARILIGGKRIQRRGYFFEPTVVSNVNFDMKIIKEETFGPLAPIIIASDEEEAVKIANDSPFGLGASIWTEDREKGERLARGLEAGMVFVNAIPKSDPRMPFGGIKKSGIGRELSHYGLKEFVNIKSIEVY